MLQFIFLFCAIVAGSVFLLQFVLLLVGFGIEGAGFDGHLPEGLDADIDVPDGMDLPHGGDVPDVGNDHASGVVDHGSTWLFGVISFRSVVAALTFFGLAGMAATSTGQGGFMSLLIALAAGAAALFGVHFLMRSLYRLGQDGTFRIHHALGLAATVYVPIPANNSGAGKIHVRSANGVEEIAAMAKSPEPLPTGSKVRVVGIIAGNTVRVEPIRESAKAAVS